MRSKRAVVIGAGLAGLAAAIHLRRQGREVLLLEAGDSVGGCCATTDIDGYRFNDGAMYIALPRLLDHAFGRIGLDREALLPLMRIDVPQATVLPGGTCVSFPDGEPPRVTGEDGDARSEKLAIELGQCLEKWRPILRLFADELLPWPLSAPRLMSKAWRVMPKLHGKLDAELRRLFSDPETRAAAAAITLYTGLPADATPIAQIFGLVAMLDEGFHLPVGGMGAITEALRREFEAAGGVLRLGARVTHIGIGNGRVATLTLADGEQLVESTVVCTASAMATFGEMIDPAQVPVSIARRLRGAGLSHRAVSIQLGLAGRIDAPAFVVNHVPLMEHQHEFVAPQPGRVEWLAYSVPSRVLGDLAPPGGSVVEMFAAVDPAMPVSAWTDEMTGKVAEATEAALARLHPLDVRVRRVRGPRHFAERMNLFDGALYGLSPAAGPMQQFPHATPIQGLFLAGQTSYPGYGVAPAMISGILAAEAVQAQAEAAAGASPSA
ncbi:MAG: NAD(P)/FAD-dependent oxidoreductase [Burkholderiaceae bacterium]|nr:NAD(P)/FAD-dependent oxidoreductase [Burkholderiaceae bacterium]MEB2319929.1 NAD(P)/FAD-dependent oxidoreductase [Pseudomonadota bacterium]